jgi:ferredoxin-NADP reductase
LQKQKLKAGDVLEVGTPEGKFTFEPQAERQKLCGICSWTELHP